MKYLKNNQLPHIVKLQRMLTHECHSTYLHHWIVCSFYPTMEINPILKQHIYAIG
jgi:hypothetical protein